MSRDDIASFAEKNFPVHITDGIIDSNQNQIYIVPFNAKSIVGWQIVDINPSVAEMKKSSMMNHIEFIYMISLFHSMNFIWLQFFPINQSYFVKRMIDFDVYQR